MKYCSKHFPKMSYTETSRHSIKTQIWKQSDKRSIQVLLTIFQKGSLNIPPFMLYRFIGLPLTEAVAWRWSAKKGVLKNFAKFTGKHLSHACNFIKKETLVQVFFCEFCEIFKNTFLERTSQVAASYQQETRGHESEKSSGCYVTSSEHHKNESAKLRALRAKNVLTYQRALRAYVLTCSRTNVPCVLTFSRANVSCVLMCSRAQMLTCQRALRAYVLILMPLFSVSLKLSHYW